MTGYSALGKGKRDESYEERNKVKVVNKGEGRAKTITHKYRGLHGPGPARPE